MEYIASQYPEVDDDTLEVTYTWGVYARTSRLWVVFCETEEEARNRAAQLNQLDRLETAFETSGGRGVDLAERIDKLRKDVYRKTRTLKITIEYDASTQEDPVEWNWRSLLDLDPDYNVIVEPFED